MSSQSGPQIGAENLAKLQCFFEQLESNAQPVPLTKEGRPNLSAIALACGFDRQVLYKNPNCRDLVASKLGSIGGSAQVLQPSHKTSFDPKEKRIRELEKKVADLTERLAQAERELEHAQVYQKLYNHVLETGRDIVP